MTNLEKTLAEFPAIDRNAGYKAIAHTVANTCDAKKRQLTFDFLNWLEEDSND